MNYDLLSKIEEFRAIQPEIPLNYPNDLMIEIINGLEYEIRELRIKLTESYI